MYFALSVIFLLFEHPQFSIQSYPTGRSCEPKSNHRDMANTQACKWKEITTEPLLQNTQHSEVPIKHYSGGQHT
jgi:hypothetical protein